eukprot:gnl/TRDRNA2_/TRDRNA2_37821_c0_seq2.p1 gnl/TRDRNA2_/TRDRNA2_37821_c0~~gnl/TRDRNA2_/TRDRNA2_37821_c0_seq2.p1  ORF type:complete len:275 (-),score=27.06 gnl/TRDRNA2_/TRDRNA2_37821_c0_seq2:339-1163(-)
MAMTTAQALEQIATETKAFKPIYRKLGDSHRKQAVRRLNQEIRPHSVPDVGTACRSLQGSGSMESLHQGDAVCIPTRGGSLNGTVVLHHRDNKGNVTLRLDTPPKHMQEWIPDNAKPGETEKNMGPRWGKTISVPATSLLVDSRKGRGASCASLDWGRSSMNHRGMFSRSATDLADVIYDRHAFSRMPAGGFHLSSKPVPPSCTYRDPTRRWVKEIPFSDKYDYRETLRDLGDRRNVRPGTPATPEVRVPYSAPWGSPFTGEVITFAKTMGCSP